MADSDPARWIVPTEDAKTLPAQKILTGRGFITGKSGSGKSNTASVVAEELLDNGYNLLVIDPEGEYFGLKESYEMLHVGNDDFCDVQVTAEDADRIATVALEQNVPVILDVSAHLDAEEAEQLIAGVLRKLYELETQVRKPFLVMVEEMQEYLPQQGASTELSELLERVAKRGRKHGLGMLGMSQRPSSVDKDFITQCDWMVWHRLNWKNDLDVVSNILGSEKAAEIEDFEPGEAYLMTDWDDTVERVQFSRKKTHDAGATPGLESYERPDLTAVSQSLISAIQGDEPLPTDRAGTDGATGQPMGDVDLAERTGTATDAISDEPTPVGDRPDAEPAPASGTLGVADPPAEVPHLDPDEVETLPRPELRDHVEALQRRNRMLADEVTELRTIVSEAGEGADRFAVTPGSTDTSPNRPRPPPRPETRSGLAGTLIEFMAMTTYLLRSLVYRIRLVVYRLAGPSE